MSYTSTLLKFTLFLIVIFHYEIESEVEVHKRYFFKDLKFCEQCFQHQIKYCTQLFNRVEEDFPPNVLQSIINLLSLNFKRLTSFMRLKIETENAAKIIIKSLPKTNLKSLEHEKNFETLRETFFETENLDGLQFCPSTSSARFVKLLQQQTQHNELSIWLHFLLNMEPLLMPLLESENFPVPKTYGTCGFTIFQANVGKALLYYYNASFNVKCIIAKQLLGAALKFSKGLAGFRFYITDLSSDNIVWNEETLKLYFVDLDTLIIVDSEAVQNKQQTHKHTYIECNDCFAYSQQEICAHNLSDINIFAACQLLREDLSRNREAGFLYPIPEKVLQQYPQIITLLDRCVDCMGAQCTNRFITAEDLIKLFDLIVDKST